MEEETSYENLVLLHIVMAHKTETYQIALRKNKLCLKRLPIKLYIFFLRVFFIIF